MITFDDATPEELEHGGSVTPPSHTPSEAAVPAPANEVVPIGRQEETVKKRQAVYLPPKIEGLPELGPNLETSTLSGITSLWVSSMGSMVNASKRNPFEDSFQSTRIAKPSTAKTFLEPWHGDHVIRVGDNKTGDQPTASQGSTTGQREQGTVARAVGLLKAKGKGGQLTVLASPIDMGLGSKGSAAPTPRTPADPFSMTSPPVTAFASQDVPKEEPLPYSGVNCLDENHLQSTSELWWRESREKCTPDDLHDVPHDMYMEVCYPQQGFYVKKKKAAIPAVADANGLSDPLADGTSVEGSSPTKAEDCLTWNERFNDVYNLGETAERRVLMAAFIREFTVEAVPIALAVLGNINSIPSPVLHHSSGITVEIPSLTPPIKTMYESDPLRAQKVANREFHGRELVLQACCPQLSVPFTLLVEYLGEKALVYPSLPLNVHVSLEGKGSSERALATIDSGVVRRVRDEDRDELVYGLHHWERFHEEDEGFRLRDTESNAIMQRLALLIKNRGVWIGREFQEKRFIFGSLETQGFRSVRDNRIYLTNLRKLTSSNVISINGSTEDTVNDDDVASPTSPTTSAAATGGLSPDGLVRLAQSPNDYYIHRFRPEFVRFHQTCDLTSECPSPACKINIEHDNADRMDQVRHLVHYIIPQAAEQFSRDCRLNGITWPLIRNGGISNFLHSWGVNLRFIILVHQKLVRTKLSSVALFYVETEIVARSLKRMVLSSSRSSVTGKVRDIEVNEALCTLLAPFTADVWKNRIWPAVLKKYPAMSHPHMQKWELSRVDQDKVLQRLMHLLGVSCVVGDEQQPCATFKWIETEDQASSVQFVHYPRVRCPKYPRAPLEEGQDVHLMCLAKRYLREVSFDLKFKPASDREMVERYINFLSQLGQGQCEEVGLYYTAEQERKDRVLKGSKPTVFSEAGKDDKSIKYRLTENRGMRIFDISKETMDKFKFYYSQKVQQTLGADCGKISSIVGVLDGVLYHHPDDKDGAEEFFGRHYAEVQANYGLVLLDKLIAMRRYQLQLASESAEGESHHNRNSNAGHGNAALVVSPKDVMIKKPFHLTGERGLHIFETADEVVFESFQLHFGQVLLFVRGPKKGQVTSILGCIDGALWHMVDGASQPEIVRLPPIDQRGDGSEVKFSAFKREDYVLMFHHDLVYPMDAKMVFDDGLDIFAGYRSCVALGFFYRQQVLFHKGPRRGEKGVVLGAHNGSLQVLLPYRRIPVTLGSLHSEIIDEHGLHCVGVLSYDPTVSPPPQKVAYPSIGGELTLFDVSYYQCLALGAVRGHRIKIVKGLHCGLNGFVIGALKGKLWAQLNGEYGAIPLAPNSFEILQGSIFDAESGIDTCGVDAQLVFPKRDASGLVDPPPKALSFWFLAEFGEVVEFDASPATCAPFGYYHSQRLRIQREILSFERPDLSADVVFVAVVGVFQGELFYVVDGEPFARPFAARSRWDIDHSYSPDVVGLSPLTPWADVFCGDRRRFCLSQEDACVEHPEIAIAFSKQLSMPIGLDTRRERLPPNWVAGMTIIRLDFIASEINSSTGLIEHHPQGPQATVIGSFDSEVFVEMREDEKVVSLLDRGTAGQSSLPKVVPLRNAELSKWLPCPSWKNQKQKSFLGSNEIVQCRDYEKRMHNTVPETPRYAFWWGYIDDPKITGVDEPIAQPPPPQHEESLSARMTTSSASLSNIQLESVSLLTQDQSASPSAAPISDAKNSDNADPGSSPDAVPRVPELVLLDRLNSTCLDKVYELNDGKRGSHYDVDGGCYSIESMTYKRVKSDNGAEMVYPLVRESLETVNSYCHFHFRINLRKTFPAVHDALVMRAVERLKVMHKRSARIVAERRCHEIVFAQPEEQDILHEVCELAPALVQLEVNRRCAELSPTATKQIELRFESFHASLHPHIAKWILKCMGHCDTGPTPSISQLFSMIYVMEQAIPMSADLPTREEFMIHVEHELRTLVQRELHERREVMQQEAMWWRKVLPLSGNKYTRSHKGARSAKHAKKKEGDLGATVAPYGSPNSLQQDPFESAASRVLRNCLGAEHHATVNRFTLQDGSQILLEPSCMSLKRGDVIEYGKGDLAGIKAVILGMNEGLLWRYELSGYYKDVGMPFAGDEDDIRAMYGFRVLYRSTDNPHSPSAIHRPLSIRAGNDMKLLCFDGVLRDFDVSFSAVHPFGVRTGDRLCVTDATNTQVFPFKGLVVVIAGVCQRRLWFMLDQTGAMPFPHFDSVVNIVEHYQLRRVCSGPIVFPDYAAPSGCLPRLVPCQGVVGEEEGEVLGKGGPSTLLFSASSDFLERQFGVASGSKVAITSGPNRGKRFLTVGARHGKLWVLWEHETAARALKDPLGLYDFKVLSADASGGFRSIESTTSLAALPPMFPPCDDAWLRFPTQRGGLALFETTSVKPTYGLNSGQSIQYSVVGKKGLPKKSATVVGVREGVLWKVDAFDGEAKPFIGVKDIGTLQKKFDIVVEKEAAPSYCFIESQTW